MIRQTAPIKTKREPGSSGRMGIEEFLAWQPEDTRWRYELDEGVVVMSPSPFWWHQKVVLYIAMELDRFVTERNLGEVCCGVDTIIDPKKKTVRCPDVFYVSRKRVAQVSRKHLMDAADLLIEVTSEGTRHVDFGRKLEQYERNPAVREYWILDIVCEPMDAYVWYRRGKQFTGGKISGPRLKSRLLKGFELDLNLVWSRAGEGRGPTTIRTRSNRPK